MNGLTADIESGYPGRSDNNHFLLRVKFDVLKQDRFTSPGFAGDKKMIISMFEAIEKFLLLGAEGDGGDIQLLKI